MELIAI